MKSKKQTTIENYFIIVVAGILLIIVLVIAYLSFQASKTKPVTVLPTPTPTPVFIPSPTIGTSNPAVETNPNDDDRLLDKVNNRVPLSITDRTAKQKILNLLPAGETSGYVYASSLIRIEYLESADLFLVEIRTSAISQSKAEANIWFRSQGMSQEGICNLPVAFYLNWDVMEELRNTGTNFSPLPNSC